MLKFILLLPLIGIIAHACEQQAKPFGPKSPETAGSILSPSSFGYDTGIYRVRLPESTLALQQWDTTINLDALLGTPVATKNRQLDQHSDTHSGSFIRVLTFEGLELKLFSPRQNGRSFWLQEIILTSPKYETVNGIRIGDVKEKVKQAYPALRKFPGGTHNTYYISDSGDEKNIQMEFTGNKLKALRMFYVLQ